MTSSLPESANLEWLRKTAKQKLSKTRQTAPETKLSDIQFLLAREYGFASWRKLKHALEAASFAEAPTKTSTTDRSLADFFRSVGEGDMAAAAAILEVEPELMFRTGPHPYWGGEPQAVHVAIDVNRPEMLDFLLGAGANPNGINSGYDYWSPMMLAAHNQRETMVRNLLQHGAQVGVLEALLMGDDAMLDTLTKVGRASLPRHKPVGSLFALARTPFAIDRLFELDADIQGADRWGADVMEALSRLGKRGRPLVSRMQRHGETASAEDLARLGDRLALERLKMIDPAAVHDDAVFISAVEFGHVQIARWLLSDGSNVNVRTDFGSQGTALHLASWNGDLEMVKLLLDHGADINALDEEYQNTPLGWAQVARTVTNNPDCTAVEKMLASRQDS